MSETKEPDYKAMYEDLLKKYVQMCDELQMEGLAIQNAAVNKKASIKTQESSK